MNKSGKRKPAMRANEMMFQKHLRNMSVLMMIFLLTACSSGGGDDEGNNNNRTPTLIIATGSADAGGSVSPESVPVNQGESVVFTVTPDTGFAIDTVSGCNGSLTGNTYTTGPITSDCTVTATFRALNYVVSTNTGGNGSISPASTNVSHGADTSFTVTPDAGFRINSVDGCSGTLSGTTYTTGTITADCTVTATFVANTGGITHTVSSSADSGGSISPRNVIVDANESVSFTLAPDIGYDIGTVTGCGGSLAGNIYTTGAITGDCTVSASFVIQTFNVNATAGTGGGISPPAQTVNYGSNADFALAPDTGYNIGTVTGCDGSLAGNVYTTGTITGDCTVSASFVIQTFNVNATAGTGGGISPPAQTVNYGSNADFTLAPDTGYNIGTVTGCGGSLTGNVYITGVITGDCTVSATFTLQPVAAISLTPGLLSFSENGGGSTLDFVLNSQPDGTVIVDLALTDTTEANLSVDQLTFDANNWSSVQTVMIDGIDDAVADGNQTTVVVANINGTSTDTTGYSAIVIPSTSFTIIDDDTAGFTVTPGTVIFSESAGTGDFELVLNSEPTADVTIDVTSNDTSETMVGNSSVSFTPADWDIPQQVSLNAVNDDLADGNQTVAIDFVINLPTLDTTGYASVASQSHVVTVTDDDVAGVTVSPDSLTLEEGGANGIITVRLNTQPDGTVLINTASSNPAGATINTTQLSFDANNWSVDQSVIVSAVADGITDPGQTLTVVLDIDAASADTTGYVSLDPADVNVTINEMPVRPIILYSIGPRDSNLGGRAGTSAMCASFEPAQSVCGTRTKYQAFLSMDESDQLVNMPAVHGFNPDAPIHTLNGTLFANNWGAMFATGTGNQNRWTIPISLVDAGILTAASPLWWSNTVSNQSIGSSIYTSTYYSCSQMSTNTSDRFVASGINGNGLERDARWLNNGTYAPGTDSLNINFVTCNTIRNILCVCGD